MGWGARLNKKEKKEMRTAPDCSLLFGNGCNVTSLLVSLLLVFSIIVDSVS